ncbi:MAG: hypothetical protein WBC50_02515 [Dehalococcoidales bacterium]
MDSAASTTLINQEMEQLAKRKAKGRTAIERWNRDATIFTYSILIIVLILLNNAVEMYIVEIVALLGLVSIWVMGFLQGRQLYRRIFDEELIKLQEEVARMFRETEGETIEDKIRQAMRDMWR